MPVKQGFELRPFRQVSQMHQKTRSLCYLPSLPPPLKKSYLKLLTSEICKKNKRAERSSRIRQRVAIGDEGSNPGS